MYYNIIEKEQPIGVIVQFGGQTALNLARDLKEEGIPLLGTSLEEIDRAEDRKKFEHLLSQMEVAQPPGVAVYICGRGDRDRKAIGVSGLSSSVVCVGRASHGDCLQ